MSEETDILIVGAGPSGGALASFLGSYGLSGIVIAAAAGTADTPRAHITNMAALECLRDIGLEPEILKVATTHGCMEHTRWCQSMAGEEYARIYSWGHDPQRKGDYDAASPCNPVDLPQTLLEPVLVKYAEEHGFPCRFNNRFIRFSQDNGAYVSEIQNETTRERYTVRSKYLFGCDGGRSNIVRQLDLPLIRKPGQGLAINLLVETDLSHLVEYRTGNLHWVMDPENDYPTFGKMAIVRMVKPWSEWMFILFPDPNSDLSQEPTYEEYLHEVQKLIGDTKVPAKIKDISKWYINEIVAEQYSEGNIFCLGDAVHRHPPFNGLGSNTCIQDAYNLAWKIAQVVKGEAGPALLSSYSAERQPVGVDIVTRANQGFRDHYAVWNALGMTLDTKIERVQAFNELRAATPAGEARRQLLREAITGTAREFHAVGWEMNQRYVSEAIYLGDEATPRPPLPSDPVLYHEITTYPGSRLPHAWLNTKVPGKQLSTIDLAGQGRFILLTGIGGDKWRAAGQSVGGVLGIDIPVYSIGWGQDYEDVYFDWSRRREIREDGCILLRPDRFVAWRYMGLVDDCHQKLLHVLSHVLSRKET
ncbi:FAD binding domain-containing protein [Paraphoma chrysanthemicola]|uniref:FAD binding domain-containing protein n=1 Tax=Paraphoma chrysanthemicola TaxID=798071 RepID=A0A8K0VSN7_9PLEO|nr:FAD binding domain-containing protein [Paraphoma chrysanthemicola]